jgi:hypothetical protein
MSTLQLGLIVAGVLFVVAVALYNWQQIRRARRRAADVPKSTDLRTIQPRGGDRGDRIEPTFEARAVPSAAQRATSSADIEDDESFAVPMDVVRTGAAEVRPAPAMRAAIHEDGASVPPDPDIECMVVLQPAASVGAGALAAGLSAKLGKPLRWLGRQAEGAPWHRLRPDTKGEFREIVACMLLADRSGAASRPLLDAFVRLVGEIAPTLPAAFVAPDTATEAERAEALDRICADLDVQIGLTVLKAAPETIPGTKLRGVAEAAGFHLREGGRFDYVSEETGAILYSLTNYRSEPFTVETLRATSTPGAVLLLDVPRVADPVRVFDQMKLVAKRMVTTLDATLVDDNRRPLDDAALAAIRQQVAAAAAALREVNIEPGSPRALALFGG